MGYDIAIVRPPVPESDADAWQSLPALIEDEGTAPDVFRDIHDHLVARYPCITTLSDEESDNGVWKDGPLWGNFRSRAAVLGIVYSHADEVVPFVIDAAISRGFAVFDWTTQLVHRPGGYQHLVLNLEDRATLRAPTLSQLEAASDALTPDGGPGFLTLETGGGDYIQIAGGRGSFTLEWRTYEGSAFRHWVAGKGTALDVDIKIPTNGFHVTVKRHEQLTATDVKTLLSAFANGNGRPTGYTWRDITAQFT